MTYTPKQTKSIGHSIIGSLLGVAVQQVRFIVNLEKLLHSMLEYFRSQIAHWQIGFQGGSR
jgi:hypothetical protein